MSRGHHLAAVAHQQGIAGRGAESAERAADGRRAQMQLGRRVLHAALLEECVQPDQEIQVHMHQSKSSPQKDALDSCGACCLRSKHPITRNGVNPMDIDTHLLDEVAKVANETGDRLLAVYSPDARPADRGELTKAAIRNEEVSSRGLREALHAL